MVDVAPTLLEMLGVPPLGQGRGVSLLPSIRDGDAVRSDLHMYYVLRTPTHKYFHWDERVFDLSADPAERQPGPVESGHWEKRIEALVAADRAERRAFEARAGPSAAAPALSEDEAAQLRALGYGE